MKATIKKIAEQHIVESVVKNVTNNSKDEDLKDLCNDIYLELMEKPESVLSGIYERDQIQYYITRIVLNNVNSKTSRFYYKYRRWKLMKSEGEIPESGEREQFDSEE